MVADCSMIDPHSRTARQIACFRHMMSLDRRIHRESRRFVGRLGLYPSGVKGLHPLENCSQPGYLIDLQIASSSVRPHNLCGGNSVGGYVESALSQWHLAASWGPSTAKGRGFGASNTFRLLMIGDCLMRDIRQMWKIHCPVRSCVSPSCKAYSKISLGLEIREWILRECLLTLVTGSLDLALRSNGVWHRPSWHACLSLFSRRDSGSGLWARCSVCENSSYVNKWPWSVNRCILCYAYCNMRQNSPVTKHYDWIFWVRCY